MKIYLKHLSIFLDENITLVEKKSDFKVLRKKEASKKKRAKQLKKVMTLFRMYLEKWEE